VRFLGFPLPLTGTDVKGPHSLAIKLLSDNIMARIVAIKMDLGAAQVRVEVPQAITIFILPPSLESLRDRLEKRAQDEQHTVEQRMDAAIDEISHYMEFDYLIVNDDFDQALREMSDVVNGKGGYLSQASQKLKLEQLISDLGRGFTPTRLT